MGRAAGRGMPAPAAGQAPAVSPVPEDIELCMLQCFQTARATVSVLRLHVLYLLHSTASSSMDAQLPVPLWHCVCVAPQHSAVKCGKADCSHTHCATIHILGAA